jgi:cell fate regulator YaaT (PSP1 superfamily)
MACTNCSCGSSKSDGAKGCGNNGTCGANSCNKLTVFDWLANMSLPSGEAPFDCVEVRFKNGRKEFYRNTENLTLSIGDIVATEASPGHDVGIVTLTGELVKIQMKKKGVDYNSAEVLKVYRKASQKDIDIWSAARDREEPMKVRARELAIRLNLEMKISDIEFQGDASKATFYYTASDRVDFRQLIKDYASEFKIRIEMKQVGFRQEASRLGGIGSCGRELCCSTWLTDFRSVNTSAARYQQLSLNPQKLAGQCGKLKCCLNFELDTYMDALKDFPDYETRLKTEKGDAVCQKQDIFKGLMWYAYTDNYAAWHVLSIEHVKEIIEINKDGGLAASLEDFAIEVEQEVEKTFNNVVGQESITRFDQPKKKSRSKSKSRNKNKSREGAVVEGQSAPSPQKNNPQKGNQPQRNPQNRSQQSVGNQPQKERQNTPPKENPNPQGQDQNQGQNPQGERTGNRNKRNKKRNGNKDRRNNNDAKNNNEGSN